jgi:hypothetical protein
MTVTAVLRNLVDLGFQMNVVGEYLGAGILHSWIDHDAAGASQVKALHDVLEPLVDEA